MLKAQSRSLLLKKAAYPVAWRRNWADTSNITGVNAFMAKGDIRTESVSVLPKTQYGGITHVTLLCGETIIGKMGAKYVKSLMSSSRVPVDTQRIFVDQGDEYFNSVLRNRAAIHVDIVHDAQHKKQSLKMCNDLDLYVFLTNLRTFPGFNCRFPDVDIQLIAQNNKGNYAELEYSPVEGVVEGLRVVVSSDIERFLRFAFREVMAKKRQKVTLVHKSSEWPKTEGVLLDMAHHLQKTEFPDIKLEPMELDKCVARLIVDPQYFDVLVTSDLYGTFMATICSAICGGANLFSSTEIGEHHAVFKPLQTKLSLTNYKVLSPYGIVSTCVDLMHHLGHDDCANALWREMIRTMNEGIKTVDFKGTDRGEYVICNIMNKLLCNMFTGMKD
ncbi:isocitrate dehydrogenase [NAD] subunit 1, mitochondrial [Drosophila grimshawi]|uniref:GH22111 n=1 Tax=Drosophila grimshawi TaxID=7222 RepID=B4J462_DROGR|nr:isocitrate dehydrogenase [NAD] subunit 1, mitochondrial [Drosophila grimshawi]EDW02668.1 GH22111 [Drosophila grimshawi]